VSHDAEADHAQPEDRPDRQDPPPHLLRDVLDQTDQLLDALLVQRRAALRCEEVGRVTFVGYGTALVDGLPGVRSQELVQFPGEQLGMAFNLDPQEVGVLLLDRGEGLHAGAEVRRTQRVLDVPVGDTLLGRVVDGVGRPVDGMGPLHAARRLPVERPAAGIMDRAPVTVPLHTGIKVIDALIPVGRGQRELILGDRQTGKTAIALDTIINQR
jgi:F-type H+-transporting ATPase subunit alpha